MSKQINDKMPVFKKMFFILLFLDVIGLILAAIALLPTFKKLAGYGAIMLGVASAMVAIVVAVMLFEILAKISLIRSTSPAFTWSSDRKGYVTAARLLLLFNLVAVIIGLLSAGGEGATLLNQANLYVRAVAAAAEIIVIIFYLRAVKKIFMDMKKES